jgi:hypothetical protein
MSVRDTGIEPVHGEWCRRYQEQKGGDTGYEVSDRLRVRSIARTVQRRDGRDHRGCERILPPAVQRRTGLLQMVLSDQGHQRRQRVHVLMREAFDDTAVEERSSLRGPLAKHGR